MPERESHHERVERDEMLKWNEEITVYAHYRLTISGEHRDRIMEDLQLLNVALEPLPAGPDSCAKSVGDSYKHLHQVDERGRPEVDDRQGILRLAASTMRDLKAFSCGVLS